MDGGRPRRRLGVVFWRASDELVSFDAPGLQIGLPHTYDIQFTSCRESGLRDPAYIFSRYDLDRVACVDVVEYRFEDGSFKRARCVKRRNTGPVLVGDGREPGRVPFARIERVARELR